ncbi:MAG: ribonuclease J [Firmicutes bacterium]|nr:ribonuclease J [Bacillota bacterium]
MTAIEYENEIIIVDCGLSFPDDDMFGIDKVIPDFSYLKNTDKKIRGLLITHGHEDHIGAVPYLLKEIKVPIYGAKFPLGLIENKLKEHGLKADMHVIVPERKFKLGSFSVEPFRITHSIADSLCFCIDTPAGKVFHTGDFKIDYTPVDGDPINLANFARKGDEGVLLMMADSTNVLRPGYTRSERVVGETLGGIFRSSKSRIIIATFSSNVHRIKKIIDLAQANGRKVAVSGRSMVNVVDLAQELGYIDVKKSTIIDINQAKNYPDKELVIITTGSQGEPMSALARMASNEHKAIRIKAGDQVILSSSPVPGNELTVANVVNKLVESGAEVIYSDIADIHVSGHASREELKLMHSLIRPKFFMPVHGEYRHLQAHAELAAELGKSMEDVFLLTNGDALELTQNSAKVVKDVCEADGIMVDGLGVGDVGNIVLRDRRLLSESGLIIVVAAIDRQSMMIASGPDIISRGFVYVRENEDLIDDTRARAEEIIEACLARDMKDWNGMKTAVREGLRKHIYSRTKRSPIILPIFLEV